MIVPIKYLENPNTTIPKATPELISSDAISNSTPAITIKMRKAIPRVTFQGIFPGGGGGGKSDEDLSLKRGLDIIFPDPRFRYSLRYGL